MIDLHHLQPRAFGAIHQFLFSEIMVETLEIVAAARLTLALGTAPLTLSVAHVDLYFFFDIDVVLLGVEVFADDLPLVIAEDVLYRFGRAYPAGWEENGQGEPRS